MEKSLQTQDKWTTVNNLTLHYLNWDNPKASPMVLLHGLCSNAHYWDFFARSMNQDYRILALDQRGHGDSSWGQSYGPRDYILDLETFATELELDNMVLIGHSMGGINAIIYAARHPDQVSQLVIVDIGPDIAAAGVERMLKDQDNEPDAFDSEEEAVEYMKRVEPRHSDSFIKHQVKYSLKHDEHGKLKFKHDKALLSTELRSPEWLWEYLGQVICPALIVHGVESDMLLAETSQKMVGILPFGSVIDIDRAGHSIPGDNPEAFEFALREFLSANS